MRSLKSFTVYGVVHIREDGYIKVLIESIESIKQ
jgi:hypothetical protein